MQHHLSNGRMQLGILLEAAQKSGPGCKHCYAATFAERFRGVPGHPYERGFDLRLVPEKLGEPLKWATPKTIFVNSMSDLFHDDLPTAYIAKVAGVMQSANWHTYQVLSKRSARLRDLLQTDLASFGQLDHIWWGVSVEDKKYGLPRIDALRAAPAAIRFLSVEPLLEDLGQIDLRGIHWVIVGGESGAGARKIEEAWVIRLLEQCRAANVPFFFKQWGGVRKSETGRTLNGQTYDEMPPRSKHLVPERHERLRMLSEVQKYGERNGPNPFVTCTIGKTVKSTGLRPV